MSIVAKRSPISATAELLLTLLLADAWPAVVMTTLVSQRVLEVSGAWCSCDLGLFPRRAASEGLPCSCPSSSPGVEITGHHYQSHAAAEQQKWLDRGQCYQARATVLVLGSMASLRSDVRGYRYRYRYTQLNSTINYGRRWLTPQCPHLSSQYYITNRYR